MAGLSRRGNLLKEMALDSPNNPPFQNQRAWEDDLPEAGHLGPGVFDGAGLEQPTVPEPGRPRSAPGAVTEASPPPFLQDRGPAQVSS